MQIKPELYQKLMKLNEKKMAIDQFVRQVTGEGQRLMNEFQVENRNIWVEIAKEHKMDLKNEDWAPSQKPNEIVCIQRRYLPSDT